MPETEGYGWPYPGPGDPPAVDEQIRDLAEAVEADVQRVEEKAQSISDEVAAMFPPSQYKRDGTTVTGNGSGHSDWESVSPEVGVEFVASSTGRAVVTVWAGLRVSAGTGRAQGDFQVFEGEDSGGTLVRDTENNPAISTDTDSYEYGDGSAQVEGLTQGATHWARLMTRSSTSSTEYDFSDRSIRVSPVS